MAEIILNVEVRDRTGTGGAREARRGGKVPGILYGGDKAPVAIAVKENEFRKALYTGKLLGHLVTLKYGDESQPVIAKDVQFHPVTDNPFHFDLMRVDEKGTVRINVPVHFTGQDVSPGLKKGGSLEIVRHDVELECPANAIPEELVVDLSEREMGDTIRMSDITLPKGVTATITDRDFVIATLKVSSAALSEINDEANAGDAEA
ncbi:50S ribosomal protein L25/general stress protein Ctc [Caulobacter sp. SLTY]|uniref:50S ribosomal protein L25/general stress protein Ctc n=1 Tax=Caulobacter sp. SLTY TaxID=2683262 RepID=UPI001412AF7F|nr:50S ribosomal protein L25/general stress protein Ctc [Caulobacter sp. SLTY]NBB16654.1 50S ribosomal protein L25/general stress protein Ctc [Caulobacter sp. SLTY]